MSTKKEQLRDKVVALVKEFLTKEGEITSCDLEILFGSPSRGVEENEVATAISKLPIVLQ